MKKLNDLKPTRVFHYFEEISAIPRGSGNTAAIADYCEEFAKSLKLKYVRDDADNIVVYKPGSIGCEKSEPIILQGHLDMVCRKTENSDKDFENDGIDLYIEGGFVKAHDTTLGADNGIAVAMILALLESTECVHPPIEAVFTSNEEIGMLGALKLDMSLLKSRRMINLDSEEEGIVTVSCASGSDFCVDVPLEYTEKTGTEVTLVLKGLMGGHSGVEIDKGHVNANLLAGRILDMLDRVCDFEIIDTDGGDKSNAIPNYCAVKLCAADAKTFEKAAREYLEIVKSELEAREPSFSYELIIGECGKYKVWSDDLKKKLLFGMLVVPNGVVQMSSEIDGLPETSLNWGILKTNGNMLNICISLRSNKKSAHEFLTRRLSVLFDSLGFEYTESGYYPPWEFNDSSKLCVLYSDVYKKICGKQPQVAAIHAGLECGVFSSAIKGMDCISVGPEMYDVHTVNERLNTASVQTLYKVLIELLKNLK